MSSLEEIVESLSAKILNLDPGPLAELRRMEPGEAGAPVFWRMAALYEWSDGSLEAWRQVVRILALLTPCGQRGGDVRLHERRRRLGAVLCDGGDPGWGQAGADPKPVLSEARLARFLASPASQRGEALERIARQLARSRSPQSGVNCIDIARLLLVQEQEYPLQDVARYYYARLDRATVQAGQEEG